MPNRDPRVSPWQIDESEFYEVEDRAAQLKFLLRYAVLAPSGHNAQPWSFSVTEEGVAIRADFTRRLAVADPSDRELLISIGAVIANFRIAAAHYFFDTTVMYEADGAVVSVRETCLPDRELARLFSAIVERRTNRKAFERREIDPAALSVLCDFVDENSDGLRFVLPHDRQHVADLIECGDRSLFSNVEFRDELASWVRPNETASHDGVCGDAFGIPGPVSALAPFMIRQFDSSSLLAKRDRELAERSAGLIVLSAFDDPVALIRAGELLERLLLVLTSLSIEYSFLNQPVQVPALRHELWKMVRTARPPQMMIRFGYAEPVKRAMPRRDVEELLGSR